MKARASGLTGWTIRCNAIDAAISMRKPSRAVRCRAELGADGLRRSDQFSGGGIGMRSTCKAAIRDGQRTNRVSWLVQVLPGLCFRGLAAFLLQARRGHWGEGLAESAENEPRDAAMGSALFFFFSSHVDASRLSTRNYRALSLAVRLCTSSRYAAGMLAADWRLSAVFSRYRRLADWFDWPLSISRRPLSRRFVQRKRWALCYQAAFEDAQRESREEKGQTSGSCLVWGGCCY